jgi:hypothetical protein
MVNSYQPAFGMLGPGTVRSDAQPRHQQNALSVARLYLAHRQQGDACRQIDRQAPGYLLLA